MKVVVVNISFSNNESKSQRDEVAWNHIKRCSKYQFFK